MKSDSAKSDSVTPQKGFCGISEVTPHIHPPPYRGGVEAGVTESRRCHFSGVTKEAESLCDSKIYQNHTKPRPEPNLRLSLPGAHIPSPNRTRGRHWSLKAAIRSSWSILLARCLSGSFGSAAGEWTTTISPAAARNCAMQSLPLSGAAEILRRTVSSGSTRRNRAVSRASQSR